MNKRVTYILAVFFLLGSAFSLKAAGPSTPDQIARGIFSALLKSDSISFAKMYEISKVDMDWYDKKLEADTLIAPETKEDYVEEFATSMHTINSRLPKDFHSKWLEGLKNHGIKKEDVRYIQAYYLQTNKKMNLDAISLEIKFLSKGSYYFVEVTLLEINGKWKGLMIEKFELCDKYFDGY
jgi:hypothetical protein